MVFSLSHTQASTLIRALTRSSEREQEISCSFKPARFFSFTLGFVFNSSLAVFGENDPTCSIPHQHKIFSSQATAAAAQASATAAAAAASHNRNHKILPISINFNWKCMPIGKWYYENALTHPMDLCHLMSDFMKGAPITVHKCERKGRQRWRDRCFGVYASASAMFKANTIPMEDNTLS